MFNAEKSILKTISFFNIFDYPLTAEEIYRWLFSYPDKVEERGINFLNIKEKLIDKNFQKNSLIYNNGFYCLENNSVLLKKRRDRYLVAIKKYQKFLKIAKILSLVPFVRMIAVSDGLSYNNSKEEDDIDILVVTEKQRIWSVRFFLILILKILHVRPTPLKKKNKICLSFLITEQALNLKKIMIEEKEGYPDVYFIYWLSWLYPVYQEQGIWLNFLEKNQWIKEYLPFWFAQEPNKLRNVNLSQSILSLKKKLERFYNIIFSHWFESFFRWYQIKIMPSHLKKTANRNTSVIISEEVLKFHDKDKREKFREKFIDEISKIIK